MHFLLLNTIKTRDTHVNADSMSKVQHEDYEKDRDLKTSSSSKSVLNLL